VDALLEARADVRLLSQNEEGNTALHAALAGRRDLRIVSRLLASGADVNARATGGYTPLHIAAFHDDVNIVNTLLAHGAAAEARDDQGRTPLTIAEAQGQTHVARRLRGEMP
jgi:ankyrin repeat protein